jgi:ADP-heptose:LPS heptosyltransferase
VLHIPVDRPEKQWPLRHFAELSDLLLADGRFETLFTFGPGQQAVADEAAALARRAPVVSPVLSSLKHFAALMQHAALFFGGDTGPMHIANAMDVPTVVVFGGTDPAKHAPMRPPFEVLFAGAEPFPARVSLAQAQQWLEAVTPDQAYDACVRTALAR